MVCYTKISQNFEMFRLSQTMARLISRRSRLKLLARIFNLVLERDAARLRKSGHKSGTSIWAVKLVALFPGSRHFPFGLKSRYECYWFQKSEKVEVWNCSQKSEIGYIWLHRSFRLKSGRTTAC